MVLILAALIPGGRWVAGLIGGGAIAGGALILAEYEWTQTELAAEKDFGWVAIAIGAAAYIGAMVPTRRRSRHAVTLIPQAVARIRTGNWRGPRI